MRARVLGLCALACLYHVRHPFKCSPPPAVCSPRLRQCHCLRLRSLCLCVSSAGGRVWLMGSNSHRQLGRVDKGPDDKVYEPTAPSLPFTVTRRMPIVQVALGQYHSAVLRDIGSGVHWGLGGGGCGLCREARHEALAYPPSPPPPPGGPFPRTWMDRPHGAYHTSDDSPQPPNWSLPGVDWRAPRKATPCPPS